MPYEGGSGIQCKRCGNTNADVELGLCSACVCAPDNDYEPEDDAGDDTDEICTYFGRG